MTQKERDVTNYIINEVIFLAKKSVPFNPNDFISSFPGMKMAPFKNGESLEASIYALLVSMPDVDDYIDMLLKDGFVERLLEDTVLLKHSPITKNTNHYGDDLRF